MTDSYRLPYNLPQNSHDWEEGTTSTDEWNAMIHSQYEFRPQKVDSASGQVIQEEGYYPIDATYELAQAQQYRSLTHQGRIRICSNFDSGGIQEILGPKAQYLIERDGQGLDTPSYSGKGQLFTPIDNHEYIVKNNVIEVRFWDSAKAPSSGEFMPLAVGDIGDEAHKAMLAYLEFLSGPQGENFKASGAEKTENGVVLEDSTDVKPDAETIFRRNLADAKEAKKDSVEFVFDSNILEPILGKGTLQECLFSLARYGYFKDASQVDIAGLKVTFATKAAEDFLLQLFGQKQFEAYSSRGVGLENIADYTGPTTASIQFYYYGGSPKTYDDDVMESMAVYRARENAFTTPVETDYDYATSLPLGKFGTINENVPFGLAYQFIPILVPLDSVNPSTGLGTAKLVDLAKIEIPGYFTRFTNYNQLNAIQLPQGWRLPKPEELAVFTKTIASDVTMISEDETIETLRYNYDPHPECYVAGRSANGNIVPMARIWLTDQPAPPLKTGFTQESVLIEGNELRPASPYINFKVGSMMTHEELLFLMEFCRVTDIEQPLFQLATNSEEKTTQIYDDQLYHLYEGVIPRLILEKALEGLNTLLAQGSSATSAWGDEPINYQQLTAMRDYVEALLDNDLAAAAKAKERFQATQDQAVDGQSARKWGTITGVLSLFIFASITPWGQSAIQKLGSMGKLPAGLARLHQKALAKVKLAKYHGQERVRAMITQALLKKARGEKVKSIVILGEPGTGKSALVMQIFYEFSTKYPKEAAKLGLLKADITEINKELGIVGADSRVADAFWKYVMTDDMVTFIDEIHRLQGLGSHSGSPISQFNEGAKEGLEQRRGLVLAASTPDEWARFQESDKAFAQRFDVLYMDSITVDQRLDMLRDQAREIKKEKNRIFSDAALRYIMDNYVTLEPDKHPNRGSKDVLLSIDMQLDAEGYTKKEVGLDDIEAAFAKIVEARQKAKLESLVGKIKAALQKVRDDTGIQPHQIGFSSTVDYEALSKKDGEEWHQAFYRLNNLLTMLNAVPMLMSEKSPEEVIALVHAAVEKAKKLAIPSSSRRSGPTSGGAPASPPPDPFDTSLLGIRSQELYDILDSSPSPRDPSLNALLESLRTIYAKKDGESERDRIARLNPIEGTIHKVLYRRKRILGGTIWNGQVERKPIDTNNPLTITGARVSTDPVVVTLKDFLDAEARKVRPTPPPLPNPTTGAAAVVGALPPGDEPETTATVSAPDSTATPAPVAAAPAPPPPPPVKTAAEIVDDALRPQLASSGIEHGDYVNELNEAVYVVGNGLNARLALIEKATAEIAALDKTDPATTEKARGILMKAMLDASQTIPGFDINKCPKLKAYQISLTTAIKKELQTQLQAYVALENKTPPATPAELSVQRAQILLYVKTHPYDNNLCHIFDTLATQISIYADTNYPGLPETKKQELQVAMILQTAKQMSQKGIDTKSPAFQSTLSRIYTQTLTSHTATWNAYKSPTVTDAGNTGFTTGLATNFNTLINSGATRSRR